MKQTSFRGLARDPEIGSLDNFHCFAMTPQNKKEGERSSFFWCNVIVVVV